MASSRVRTVRYPALAHVAVNPLASRSPRCLPLVSPTFAITADGVFGMHRQCGAHSITCGFRRRHGEPVPPKQASGPVQQAYRSGGRVRLSPGVRHPLSRSAFVAEVDLRRDAVDGDAVVAPDSRATRSTNASLRRDSSSSDSRGGGTRAAQRSVDGHSSPRNAVLFRRHTGGE